MNRICKIIGAVAVAGAAVIAGTIFYRKGYGKGYNKALRDSDEMGDDFV